MLMRNMSAPALNSCSMLSGVLEEGPSVARILTFRRRLIGLPHLGFANPSSWMVQLSWFCVSTS